MAEAAYTFPSDFLWGTATSAHQVEGDNRNNDWWQWEQERGGRVFADHVSGAACGWWEGRALDDIERMAALNTNAHRLSSSGAASSPGKAHGTTPRSTATGSGSSRCARRVSSR